MAAAPKLCFHALARIVGEHSGITPNEALKVIQALLSLGILNPEHFDFSNPQEILG